MYDFRDMPHQIVCRSVRDDFQAVTLANIITFQGGEVLSITYADIGQLCWSVWARIHRDNIDLVDRDYAKWLEGGSAT